MGLRKMFKINKNQLETTKNNVTYIVSVLDRSGSMGALVNDVIGGYNTFIEAQKEVDGSTYIFLTIFDTSIDTIASRVPLDEVIPLTNDVYYARGGTSLLDAVGITITELQQAIAASPENEKPDNVIFMVNTDGQENSSSKFTKDQIAKMISDSPDTWQFVFMGADQDAWGAGSGIGITNVGNTLSYGNTKRGIGTAYSTLTANTVRSRKAGTVSANQGMFSDKDRETASETIEN